MKDTKQCASVKPSHFPLAAVAFIAGLLGWTSSSIWHNDEPQRSRDGLPANNDVGAPGLPPEPFPVAITRPETPQSGGVKPVLPSDALATRNTNDQILDALQNGSDNQRHAAIIQAQQQDFELPPDLLINTYVNDASDEVRILAFTAYIDSVSDDVEVVRAALQSATNNTSALVQEEAYRRLDELARYEDAVAATPAQKLP